VQIGTFLAADRVKPDGIEALAVAAGTAGDAHAAGDGSDHADVATNTLKVSYTDAATVAANAAKLAAQPKGAFGPGTWT